MPQHSEASKLATVLEQVAAELRRTDIVAERLIDRVSDAIEEITELGLEGEDDEFDEDDEALMDEDEDEWPDTGSEAPEDDDTDAD